ncbi:hypothetical protein GRI97_11840 [Altererythrobacter xixiisoli]|uniref:Lipoprotein n=1 Tax=Croceibacterium xixiisoli TaxID=1476466 RepID=A0A6I4TX54_9SPHN|nr:hypothetical protein [Croceibacterium xixiisoli]MXO99681.1 hypothetical protein [Croceibacterium xixiisoli]
MNRLPARSRSTVRLGLALAMLLPLGACGPAAESEPADDQDPAVAAALGDPLMVDPDLAGQNAAGNAASIGTQDGSVPSFEMGAETIAAARAEALQLVGGAGKMVKAPEPREISGRLPEGSTLTAAALAAAVPASGDCAARVQYTMDWAARLPVAFPVFPRGAVQEAAGTDAEGCRLRVVNFKAPVPPAEVMDFYYTRAAASGFSTQRVLQDGDDVLAGTKARSSFVIYVRPLPSGGADIDLVTNAR